MWDYTGKRRPDFADVPGPGQESVWDYPRPPVLVHCDALVEVCSGDSAIVSTRSSRRVLETASPPTYYLPGADIDWAQLVKTTAAGSLPFKPDRAIDELQMHYTPLHQALAESVQAARG